MNKSFVLGSVGMVALLGPMVHAQAQSQEVGRVISSVPVIQQVAVPRQVCNSYPVAVEQPRSGAGALMGALAGGAAGNAIGDGGGRAVATVIGALGGALLGDRIESPGAQLQQQTHCTTQTFHENRTVGYNVTYEYAGTQRTVQMPHDPGPTIALQLVPVGTAPAQPAPTALDSTPAPAPLVAGASAGVGTPEAVVIREWVTVPAPGVYPPAYGVAPGAYLGSYPGVYPGVYPAPLYRPYYRPYYPPRVSLSLGFVSGGHRHHRHSHRHGR